MLTLKNRQKIAKTFGQSCESYDSNARLQRFSGTLLCQYVEQIQRTKQSQIHNSNDCPALLDLGCGTGHFTQILANKNVSRITALDLSKDMLGYAKTRDYADKPISWLQGDAHSLPLVSQCKDVIFSNLVLQWTQPLNQALQEAYRVLKPGGYLIFSTLTDGTLFELKQAWAKIDNDKHVIDYLTVEEVENAWQQVGFHVVDSHPEAVELPYPSVNHLARELKHLGASLVRDKQNKGLTGKTKWKQMCQEYKKQEVKVSKINGNGILSPDHINATYQLYTACLKKPEN